MVIYKKQSIRGLDVALVTYGLLFVILVAVSLIKKRTEQFIMELLTLYGTYVIIGLLIAVAYMIAHRLQSLKSQQPC